MHERIQIHTVLLDKTVRHQIHENAIALEVPNDELISRLFLRGKQSGRADDQDKSIIANRIKVYENQTAVLAEYYKAQNKLATVNGVGSVDEITKRLYRSIDL